MKKENKDHFKVKCMNCGRIHWYDERPRREPDKVSVCPKCKHTAYMYGDDV